MNQTSIQDTRNILAKALDGQRLTAEDGLALLNSNQLAAIGSAADQIARRLHPENYRTYNIDRNINYLDVYKRQVQGFG